MALLGELVVKVIGDITGLNRSMDLADKRVSNFQKKMKGIGTSMSQVGRGMTMGITLPALALGGAILKVGADFDSAMTESLAIMGDISPQIREQMEETARTIATTTKFSADQAAESYFFLASAGLDAAQSIEALPKVARFAQAGNFDMALATDLLTDAQSALGMTIRDDVVANMENMVKVSDVLVKANTLANATVQQFSESLTNDAAAAMRLVNKDIEEGVAVLAVFADQGLKGAAAGSSLAIVFRDLQKASLENRDIFDEMGVSVFDANGNMRNMADIVDDLSGLLAGMSDEEKKATLMMLGFQERSVKNIQLLLGTGDAMREYEKGLREAGGITQEIADNQMESMSAQLGLLKDKAIEVALAFFEKLQPTLMNDVIPALGDLLDAMVPVIETIAEIMPGLIEEFIPKMKDFAESLQTSADRFADLDPKMQSFIIKLGGMAVVAGPLLMILGPLARGIGAISGPLGKMGGLLGKGLAGGAGTGAAALGSFTLVGAALAGIVVGQKKLSEVSEELDNQWGKLATRGMTGWFGVSKAVEESVPLFKAVVDGQVPVLTAITMTREEMLKFNETGEAQNTMWQGMIGAVDNWETETMGKISNWFSSIGDMFSSWGENISIFFTEAWEKIKTIFIEAGKAIWAWMLDWIPGLNLIVENWDEMVAYFGEKWEVIKNFFIKYGTIVKDFIVEKFNIIKDKTIEIWNAISNFFSEKWEIIKGIFEPPILWIEDKVDTVFTAVSEKISEIWNGVKDYFAGLWDDIKENFDEFKTGFLEIWDKIADGLKKPINKIIGFLNRLIDGVQEAINMVVRQLNKIDIKVPNWVGKIIPGLAGREWNVNMGEVSFSKIPELATGGDISQGGLAVVGERGKEIVDLPKGARVTPLEQIDSSTSIQIFVENLSVREEADIQKIAEALKDQQDIKTRGLGVSII